jgi:hypothetical protein
MHASPPGLSEGPIVVFWSHTEQHRLVIPIGWAEAKALWQRILRRFHGGLRHYTNAQASLGQLAECGVPVSTRFHEHLVGLVRVYGHGSLEGLAPVMICKEGGPTGREPRMPILVPSIEVGRNVVRQYRDCGIRAHDWRCYNGEYLEVSAEKLFRKAPDGSVVGRTQLEEDLVACFGPAGRARQKFPPLPAYTEVELPGGGPDIEPPSYGGTMSGRLL